MTVPSVPHVVHREPVFSYVTAIDPALSTFGWKIVGLAHLAMVLPVLGAFLPRDSSTRWGWVAVVCVLVGIIAAANLISFTRMVRSDGYRSPPAWWVLTEVLTATVAAGIMSYALGGATGMYRPLVFVPLLLMAMIGNRWMIVVTWAVAVATIAVSAVASGVIDEGVVALVFSYGVAWGVTAIMVHLLALSALHSDNQVYGLAEVAGIAAQANSLVEGTEKLLPVVAEWAGAKCAGAYRIVVDTDTPAKVLGLEHLASWPHGADLRSPEQAELSDAQANRGVVLDDRRALMVTGVDSTDGAAIAIVLEGMDQPAYDRLMTRFNLERMAWQVGVLVDRSRYIARLETLGRTDGLTGLPNRRALNEQLTQAHVTARRRGEDLSVVMIDLDHFKDFNDSFGHLAGDDLLRSYATRLRTRLRSGDFVARYGGEEFCAILPGTDGKGAEQVFEELHRSFRHAEELHGVTFSAGVAVWDGTEDAPETIGRADDALYLAKAAGRDRTIVDRLTSLPAHPSMIDWGAARRRGDDPGRGRGTPHDEEV